jgi:8-oxo-dGTP pyrophosphatase MutT (NUDIX family)
VRRTGVDKPAVRATPPDILRPLIRLVVGSVQALRRAAWFILRPTSAGVSVIPVTRDGRVVLVRLTYARGWHLPGGGQRRGETPAAAAERELREEIGLRSHEGLSEIGRFFHRRHYKHETISVHVARGVRYDPAWSIEVEAVAEFEHQSIPGDAIFARTWVAKALSLGMIEGDGEGSVRG